jgi:DNA uptake protein ComE-like DNA-binding protein
MPKKIIDSRPFANINDILQAKGIGQKFFGQIKDKIII